MKGIIFSWGSYLHLREYTKYTSIDVALLSSIFRTFATYLFLCVPFSSILAWVRNQACKRKKPIEWLTIFFYTTMHLSLLEVLFKVRDRHWCEGCKEVEEEKNQRTDALRKYSSKCLKLWNSSVLGSVVFWISNKQQAQESKLCYYHTLHEKNSGRNSQIRFFRYKIF